MKKLVLGLGLENQMKKRKKKKTGKAIMTTQGNKKRLNPALKAQVFHALRKDVRKLLRMLSSVHVFHFLPANSHHNSKRKRKKERKTKKGGKQTI